MSYEQNTGGTLVQTRKGMPSGSQWYALDGQHSK